MTTPSRLLAALAACALILALPVAAGAANPKRYRTYYKLFDRGKAKIPGDDTRWIPQGLTYWPQQDALIISYYDGEHAKNSRLAVIDRASGQKQKILELPEQGHVGGLAMSRLYLWVASSGNLSRIAKTELAGTANGGRLRVDSTQKAPATSFATMEGDHILWLGNYEHHKTTAYRYPLGLDDALPSSPGKVTIPSNVQGMAVFGKKVVLSRSPKPGSGEKLARNADSLLQVRPVSKPTSTKGSSVTAPNMSEGLVFAQGELHVLYESGAKEYNDADYRVKTIHHALTGDVLG
jgi:hypothetical protein